MLRRKKPGDLAFGYRLQYCQQDEHLLSETRSWRKKKDGLPPEWEQIKQNPQMVRGRLFKSGRLIDTFLNEYIFQTKGKQL